MTPLPQAPGRHAGPAPREEEPDDWLSAPARAEPRAGLPSGLGDARRPATYDAPDPRPDDWGTRRPGPAPAFEDAFAAYTSQTGPGRRRPVRAPTHAARAAEPDPWPVADPPAWESPPEEWRRPARSHRRQTRDDAGLRRRPYPLVYGLVGLLVGLALSVLAILALRMLFPALLPSL